MIQEFVDRLTALEVKPAMIVLQDDVNRKSLRRVRLEDAQGETTLWFCDENFDAWEDQGHVTVEIPDRVEGYRLEKLEPAIREVLREVFRQCKYQDLEAGFQSFIYSWRKCMNREEDPFETQKQKDAWLKRQLPHGLSI